MKHLKKMRGWFFCQKKEEKKKKQLIEISVEEKKKARMNLLEKANSKHNQVFKAEPIKKKNSLRSMKS